MVYREQRELIGAGVVKDDQGEVVEECLIEKWFVVGASTGEVISSHESEGSAEGACEDYFTEVDDTDSRGDGYYVAKVVSRAKRGVSWDRIK